MQVQIHFQDVDHSEWMDQFIANRVEKLSRHLSPSSIVHVFVKMSSGGYSTNLVVHDHHDYSFHCEGENLFESFSGAIEKATRDIVETKRRIKDKVNKKFFSLTGKIA